MDLDCLRSYDHMSQVTYQKSESFSFQKFLISFDKCRFKDAGGWHLVFTSPWMDNHIDRVALNARMTSSGGQNQAPNSSSETKMVALASGTTIRLWAITDDGQRNDIGNSTKTDLIYLICTFI